MRNSFNADFYIAAATVLPVLYLALVLEGSTYKELLHRAEKAWSEADKPYEIYALWRILAYAIWSLWAGGEVIALYSLYKRSDIAGSFVFGALVILILAVTAGPALAYFKRTPRPGYSPPGEG